MFRRPTPMRSQVFAAPGDIMLLPAPLSEGDSFLFVQVIGAFTGTLLCEDSQDGGVTFNKFFMAEMLGAVGDIAAPGFYRSGSVSGFIMPRIRASALSAGGPTVFAFIVAT